MQYTIRRAIAEDIEILDLIYTENMKEYVEKMYPWNPKLFRDNFLTQDYKIIEIKNKIIGFIKVVVSNTQMYLGEIQIDRNYQNQRIGTSIIKLLIQEAKIKNKKLCLKVLKSNPAANLYQRLGFTIVEESSTHKHMAINI